MRDRTARHDSLDRQELGARNSLTRAGNGNLRTHGASRINDSRRAAVAIPDVISISVCATFQPRCNAPADPVAVKMAAPAPSRAPDDVCCSTVAPAISRIRTASSAPATTIGSRAAKVIRAGLGPIPRTCVVRSPSRTSSARNSASTSIRKNRGGSCRVCPVDCRVCDTENHCGDACAEITPYILVDTARHAAWLARKPGKDTG